MIIYVVYLVVVVRTVMQRTENKMPKRERRSTGYDPTAVQIHSMRCCNPPAAL